MACTPYDYCQELPSCHSGVYLVGSNDLAYHYLLAAWPILILGGL